MSSKETRVHFPGNNASVRKPEYILEVKLLVYVAVTLQVRKLIYSKVPTYFLHVRKLIYRKIHSPRTLRKLIYSKIHSPR